VVPLLFNEKIPDLVLSNVFLNRSFENLIFLGVKSVLQINLEMTPMLNNLKRAEAS